MTNYTLFTIILSSVIFAKLYFDTQSCKAFHRPMFEMLKYKVENPVMMLTISSIVTHIVTLIYIQVP